jgi:hypothetical protein
MQTLFIISVLCFLGVVWGAIAFARHIKAGARRNVSIVPDSTQFRQLLQPALEQAHSSVPVLKSKANFASASLIAVDPQPSFTKAAFSPVAYDPAPLHKAASHQGVLRQSVRDITANKQWSMPPQSTRTRRLHLFPGGPANSAPTSNTALRKPPQGARHGNMELINPAYFSKDLGDLTDPYEPHRLSVNDRT